jgi:hypothetical protein
LTSQEEAEDRIRARQVERDFEESLKIREARQREEDLVTEGKLPRRKHWTELGGVPNLTMEHLSPKPKQQGWICVAKGCDGQRMNLLPVSHDEPVQYWQCTKCSRQITIQERDQIFEAIRLNVMDKYLLHIFVYDKQNNNWDIKSDEWPGPTRIGAKRKVIKAAEREEIIDQLLDTLEDTLQIHIGTTIKDYFLES